MKFNLPVLVLSLFFAGVIATPLPSGRGAGKKVEANIDPAKAPKTAENIREHVQKYGADTMRAQAKDFNDKETKDKLRASAIGGKNPGPGMETDEEAPALIRKPNDPVSTKTTTKAEGQHQGGKLSAGSQRAKKLGPETQFEHGIEGEDLDKIAAQGKSGGSIADRVKESRRKSSH